MDVENNLEDKYQAQQLNEFFEENLVHWEPVAKPVKEPIKDMAKLKAVKEFSIRNK